MCLYKKNLGAGFIIITVYVDDLNIIGTLDEFSGTMEYLNKEFKMIDLEKNKILPWLAN